MGHVLVKNYTEQGGEKTHIGGTLDVESGGALDVKSGGAIKIAGTALTKTAAQLNAAAAHIADQKTGSAEIAHVRSELRNATLFTPLGSDLQPEDIAARSGGYGLPAGRITASGHRFRLFRRNALVCGKIRPLTERSQYDELRHKAQ